MPAESRSRAPPKYDPSWSDASSDQGTNRIGALAICVRLSHDGRCMQRTDNVLQLIGNTPLLRVRTFDTGKCTLFLKLENHNPGGSIKDRIGRSMIEAAEREGK